jgi:ketosteroid isomerase-like protein
MDNLTHFMQYAAAFELSYADDDWSRLHQYFAPDAVYEIKSDAFPATLRGPDAIFKGMKKSLDGFDRKFDTRTIAVVDGPTIDGDLLTAGWTVTYGKAGKTPYVLPGKTTVRYRDGKITELVDSYDASVGPAAAKWMRENGMVMDPSYV